MPAYGFSLTRIFPHKDKVINAIHTNLTDKIVSRVVIIPVLKARLRYKSCDKIPESHSMINFFPDVNTIKQNEVHRAKQFCYDDFLSRMSLSWKQYIRTQDKSRSVKALL